MSPTTALTTFVTILPAELPDKTILACLILSSRYRAVYVFAGAAAAFAVQVILAVAVGGALSMLPHRWVYATTAVAFGVGAVLLWRHKEEEADDDTDGRDGLREAFWPVAGTSFAVVFLAEFGDLTQITTAGLAARFHAPLAVGTGAILALWVATGLAVIVGWRLIRLVRLDWLTKIAAGIMLILAATSALAAAAALLGGAAAGGRCCWAALLGGAAAGRRWQAGLLGNQRDVHRQTKGLDDSSTPQEGGERDVQPPPGVGRARGGGGRAAGRARGR